MVPQAPAIGVNRLVKSSSNLNPGDAQKRKPWSGETCSAVFVFWVIEYVPDFVETWRWHPKTTRHSLPGCAARAARLREYADDRHHAAVFMVEDVAVVDEITDIGAAEIHSHFYAGIRSGP